jgi:hypothetical protein
LRLPSAATVAHCQTATQILPGQNARAGIMFGQIKYCGPPADGIRRRRLLRQVKPMPDKSPKATEAEVIRMIHAHIEGLFPRTCPKCHRVFATYRDYLQNTKHIGAPVSYDIEFDDLKPTQATGNLSLANCSCGGTLALSSDGMPLGQIWQVLAWVKAEAKRRHVPTKTILTHLRTEVSKRGQA